MVDQIVEAVFGIRKRPPLGPPPAYAQLRIDALPGLSKADTLLLKLAAERVRAAGGRPWIDLEELAVEASEQGMGEQPFWESIEMLDDRGYLDVRWYASGGAKKAEVTERGFEDYARSFIPDFQALVDRVSVYILNNLEPSQSLHSRDIAMALGMDTVITDHIVGMLKRRNLIGAQTMMGGSHHVRSTSVELKRAYRNK